MAAAADHVTPDRLAPALKALAQRAKAAGVFGPLEIADGRLSCAAPHAAAPAFYRVEAADGRAWVSLVTEDRWLSGSIEGDLVHTGDKLDELIEEEMIELGYDGPRLPFEHFRSEDLLYIFRTPLPKGPEDPGFVELAAQALLGYAATFSELGDMDDRGEDD